MNNKLIKWLRIVGLSVCCGIGAVQLVFALCWAWTNGNNVQDFYDTSIYFRDAVNVCSDGWHLAGYTCILKLFMCFESMLGKNYIILLYIFQVICSLLCFAEGCRSAGKYLFGHSLPFYKLLLPAGYIITLPVVWQMQFAVLPDALCLSLVVLVMAKMFECIAQPDRIHIFSYLVIGGSVLAIGLMEHHYFYGVLCFLILNIVILFLRFLHSKYRIKKGLWQAFLILTLIICISFVVEKTNDSVCKSENYISYSVAAELLSRFVYPNLQEDYSFYTDTVKEVLPEENAQNIMFYDLYLSEVGVLMEENYDGNVSDLFVDMAKTGFSLHTKEIAIGTIKEAFLYTFVPFAMVKNMYSNGNSLYGHNYTKMYEMSPGLTADYMHAGMNGFLIIVIIGIFIGLVQFIINKKDMKKQLATVLYGLLSVWSLTIPMMLFSIMKFDYRIGLFSVYMWGIFTVGYLYTTRSDIKSVSATVNFE